MRTAEQCRAKALEMDILAIGSETAKAKADYEQMAVLWRHLANQATWQAAFKA